MSLTPKQQLEQVNNPNLLSILSTIQGLPEQVDPLSDTDLIPSNIREGIDIWGVIGTLVEGVAGIDFGEVTLASTAESVTVSHNLGVVPSFVALVPKDIPTISRAETVMNINGFVLYKTNKSITSGSAFYGESNVELTETTISFNSPSSCPFKIITYYWVAIV